MARPCGRGANDHLGSLVSGDTAAFTQSFDTKNVGTGKTLTAAGSVNDGNGGNNYAVTSWPTPRAQITARAITVTAATNSKGYDGTTYGGGRADDHRGQPGAGDTAAFSESYEPRTRARARRSRRPVRSATATAATTTR